MPKPLGVKQQPPVPSNQSLLDQSRNAAALIAMTAFREEVNKLIRQ